MLYTSFGRERKSVVAVIEFSTDQSPFERRMSHIYIIRRYNNSFIDIRIYYVLYKPTLVRPVNATRPSA